MNCYTCGYARRVYDKKGMVLGVECSRDNMQYFPDPHIKMFLAQCSKWVEDDGHE